MIELGGAYPAAIDVYGADGQPENAASVTLTIILPDGTTVTPAVANPPSITGQYSLPYITTMAGRHVARWHTTVPDTSFTDVFDVAEEVPPSIISLADIKQQLGIDPSWAGDDDELRAKLSGITAAIENYLHEVVARRAISQDITGQSAYNAVRLDGVPVISVTSIARSDGSYTWDTSASKLHVGKKSGLVWAKTGPQISGDITVAYVAGYQVVPYNYIEGAKVLFQHVWQTRRGPASPWAGGVTGPEELQDWRHFTAFPRKVAEWLGPPRPIVA